MARIRETARLAGSEVVFARTPEELSTALGAGPTDLVLVDLTTPGWDYGRLFDARDRAAPAAPVLGYTTHVLARQTQPLHARCTRVLTKDALTRELGQILRQGLAA